MTGNCGACRFWNHSRTDFHSVINAEWEDFDTEYEAASTVADEGDKLYGICESVVFHATTKMDPLPLSVVRDGSDYTASLFTRAGFGCVSHERGAWTE